MYYPQPESQISDKEIIKIFTSLTKEFVFSYPKRIVKLKGDASSRQIYRIWGGGSSFIGVYGPNTPENLAFIGFTEAFYYEGLNVPELFIVSEDKSCYLVEDFGGTTFLSALQWIKEENPSGFPEEYIFPSYRRLIEYLIGFQIRGMEIIDFSLCYQTEEFDEKAWKIDHDYFIDEFTSRFDASNSIKQALSVDLAKHREMLQPFKDRLFLYRDFQSRNIMVSDMDFWFLDYQSGRKGHPAYDIASLVYDAKADLPDDFKWKLAEHHANLIANETKISREEMLEAFPLYALLRVLQALGSYMRNAYAKGDAKYFESIPYGLKNARKLIHNDKRLVKLTALYDFICKLEEEKPWLQTAIS